MISNIDRINKYFVSILLASLTIIVLSGCQHSPRKHYYLLSATALAKTSNSISQIVGLGPIELADYLESTRIVHNADAHRMQVSAQDYWGEPLEEGMARVLAINLMNLNNARLVERFPWRRDAQPKFSLSLTIYDLQLINGEAVINASWTLIDQSTKIVLTQQRFVRNKASGHSAEAVAAAYSDLLGELAMAMDQALMIVQ